jgi:hypothetical protein
MTDTTYRPAPDEVAASTGALCYDVRADAWDAAFPDEVSALIAPPIVVSAALVAAGPARRRAERRLYRMNMPTVSPAPPRSGRHRRRARV